jgi:hypothetical protein
MRFELFRLGRIDMSDIYTEVRRQISQKSVGASVDIVSRKYRFSRPDHSKNDIQTAHTGRHCECPVGAI